MPNPNPTMVTIKGPDGSTKYVTEQEARQYLRQYPDQVEVVRTPEYGERGKVGEAPTDMADATSAGELMQTWAPALAAIIGSEGLAAIPMLSGRMALRYGAPWMARTAARGVGSAAAAGGTSAMVTAGRGGTPGWQDASRGAGEGLGTMGGIGLMRFLENLSRGWMGTALSRGASTPLHEEFQGALQRSQPAGAPRLTPEDASFADRAIEERIPVGRRTAPMGGGETGSARANRMIDEPEAQLTDILRQRGTGRTYTIQQAGLNFNRLRDELRAQGRIDDIPAAEAKLDEIRRSYTDPRTGRMRRMTATEWNQVKRQFGEVSRRLAAGRVASEKASIDELVYNNLRDTIRESLEQIDPRIRGLNQRMSEMMPVRDVVREAERQMAIHPPGAATKLERGSFMAKFNPLDNPRHASRMALFGTHPVTRFVTRQAARPMVGPIWDMLRQAGIEPSAEDPNEHIFPGDIPPDTTSWSRTGR